MEPTEIEFVEAAKRLISVYRKKLAQLEGVVAAWEKPDTESAKAKPSEVRSEKPNNITQLPKQDTEIDFAQLEMSISGWIRTAIQSAGDGTFTNRWIADKIKSLNAAAAEKLNSGRISTELFHLSKHQEILAVKQVPGFQTEYRIGPKFRPAQKWKRTAEIVPQAQSKLA